MQAGRSAIANVIAVIVLIASLAGLWIVLPGNGEVRLTGETLTAFAREHPPKPWRGFETSILDVSVDGEVRIKAHVSGHAHPHPHRNQRDAAIRRRRPRDVLPRVEGRAAARVRRARCSAGSTRC